LKNLATKQLLRLISIHQVLVGAIPRFTVDLGMRTYNRKAREYDPAIARKILSLSDFLRDRQ